ncbi:unnamed protein product, partial [Ectocarpus sp. 8 AP-2014]
MREGVQLVARPHDAPHEVPDNGHPPYWGGGMQLLPLRY